MLIRITFVFCLGILIAHKIKFDFLVIFLSAFLFFIAALLSIKNRLRFGILLFCFIFLLGIADYAKEPRQKKNIYFNRNKKVTFDAPALKIKEKIESIIFQYLSEVPAGILDAMVLGERDYIPPRVNQAMVRSGTVHILVVSGFNVGLVAFIIILFLKLIRIPRKPRILITLPLLVVYCFITGASSPVVRATIMAVVFLGAYFFQREANIYNSCAIAVLFILGVNPQNLFDLGFQLSFLSVLSIIWLYPKLKTYLHTDSLKIKVFKYLINSSLVSLSAWLGTMLPIACNFKIFSPVTVLANVLIVPLATAITFSGFSLLIFHYIYPALNKSFAYTIEFLVLVLLKINAFLIGLPFASFSLSK